ncbi:MAG: hypothetical protein UV27_C0025G0005 [candidate division WWE3 bacterium GW2011_GWA1_42_46]|nr:MAG: hypothetical protein UV27_C0025G0005 [candidate division WWE3 bacterium GW2011_GWA1_42_46]
MIFLSSDHGGLEIKKEIARYLEEGGIPHEDLGKMLETSDSKGVLICRNGVGVTIAANRYKGIRAGLSWNETHAASSRRDDNTNVLTLAADYVKIHEALTIFKAWMNTPFSNEERHKRRLAKIL